MLRGGAAGPRDVLRAALPWLLGAVTVAGCAVHNPTDLAQRPPVIPTKVTTTMPDGTPTFNRRAVSRLIAQLGYGDSRPKGKPPGPLRAFVASCRGVTAPCLNIFFFYRGRYVGAAFAQPRSVVALRGQDGRLVRATVPGPTGGLHHVQYIWTGADVIGLTATGSVTLVRTPSHTLS
ncbi:MAG TPA: hypothetical protein VF069_14705 [Streptosporangiaceae bacterium]